MIKEMKNAQIDKKMIDDYELQGSETADAIYDAVSMIEKTEKMIEDMRLGEIGDKTIAQLREIKTDVWAAAKKFEDITETEAF